MAMNVLEIAQEQQNAQRLRSLRARVAPEDDDSDPNIHVEETLNFTLTDQIILEGEEKKTLVPDWVVEGGLQVRVTLMLEADKSGT
jgi:hypothetical protein